VLGEREGSQPEKGKGVTRCKQALSGPDVGCRWREGTRRTKGRRDHESVRRNPVPNFARSTLARN